MTASASDLVTVFPTCLGEIAMTDVMGQTVAALAACGYRPVVARGVTCCGQPGYNAGFDDDSRRVAKASLAALDRTDGPIVVPAGSCAGMMHLHWRELFRGTRHERAAVRVSQRVSELTTVLAARADRLGGLGLRWQGTVAYHDSCHMLRELGISDAPRTVLAAVDGADVVPTAVQQRCCGFGGTFAVRYPEVSVAMADATLDDARVAGVDVIVSADPGCIMHLDARGARRGDTPRVVHIAAFLAEAGLR